jgi:hypothetical protein
MSLAFLSFVGPANDLMILVTRTRKLVTLDVNGRHKGTSEVFDAGLPLRFSRDSVDMLMFNDEAVPSRIVSMSLATLRAREMLTIENMLTVASDGRRIVLAEPTTYRFWSFDRDGGPLPEFGRNLPRRYLTGAEVDSMAGSRGAGGRLLPVAPRVREALMRDPVRHFYHIVFDGQGRLWALGQDESKTPFADIFADTAFVGRMRMPCDAVGFQPAFSGEWAAIPCAHEQGGTTVAIQLFRVR